MNRQTTRVGGYQPDVCRDNIVAALNVPTETMINTSPSSVASTNNSDSENEFPSDDDNSSKSTASTNDDNSSESQISLLDALDDIDLDNNTPEETSVARDHVEDHAADDDGLTFSDFEQDPDDDNPDYVGVPQRIIAPMNSTLISEVKLLHMIEKHKLPMNVQLDIWDWAVKCQS